MESQEEKFGSLLKETGLPADYTPNDVFDYISNSTNGVIVAGTSMLSLEAKLKRLIQWVAVMNDLLLKDNDLDTENRERLSSLLFQLGYILIPALLEAKKG